MKRNAFWPVFNVVALIATLVVNFLANALPFNDLSTEVISDSFEVFFVPAGYVFSIWGLIYLGLIGYAVYQALPAQRDNPRLARVDSIFWLSCLANGSWLFFWHYEIFALTLPTMLVILGSLIAIYLQLETGKAEVPAAERWLVQAPFSLYMGWISVATIANTADLLWLYGWRGAPLSEATWAVIMLAAAVVLAGLMAFLRSDWIYAAVIVWATAGIAVQQAGTPLVAGVAWGAAAAAGLVLIASLITRRGSALAPAG